MQLLEKGLHIKSGGVSSIDASVIEAKQSRPNKGMNKNPMQDPDAKWNVKTASGGKKKLLTVTRRM